MEDLVGGAEWIVWREPIGEESYNDDDLCRQRVLTGEVGYVATGQVGDHNQQQMGKPALPSPSQVVVIHLLRIVEVVPV